MKINQYPDMLLSKDKLGKLILTGLLVFLSVLIFTEGAKAQQQVMFTQYMFNPLAINPAYAGSHETADMTLLAREQWVGFEGAPSTQTFSFHSPIPNKKIGLGALIMHDKIGVTNQYSGYLAYAYKISFDDTRATLRTTNRGTLSLGIQAGFDSYDARFSQINSFDPTFINGDIKSTLFNVGFGIWYNTDRLYAGLSVPQLLKNTFDKENTLSESKQERHYFISGGYVIDLNQDIKFKPNTLLKVVKGAPVQVDLNANFLFREVFWAGLQWRSFESIDLILQFLVTERLSIGYSYDFSTTRELSSVNSGSHEFMVGYSFILNKSRIVSPRFF